MRNQCLSEGAKRGNWTGKENEGEKGIEIVSALIGIL